MITQEEINKWRVRAAEAKARGEGITDFLYKALSTSVHLDPDDLLSILDAAECGVRTAAEFAFERGEKWNAEDFFKEMDQPGTMKNERDAALAECTRLAAENERLTATGVELTADLVAATREGADAASLRSKFANCQMELSKLLASRSGSGALPFDPFRDENKVFTAEEWVMQVKWALDDWKADQDDPLRIVKPEDRTWYRWFSDFNTWMSF